MRSHQRGQEEGRSDSKSELFIRSKMSVINDLQNIGHGFQVYAQPCVQVVLHKSLNVILCWVIVLQSGNFLFTFHLSQISNPN